MCIISIVLVMLSILGNFDEIIRIVMLCFVSLEMRWCILVFVLMLMLWVGLFMIRSFGLVVSYLVMMIFC